jgi:SNF2 family DNA or RNA helicase
MASILHGTWIVDAQGRADELFFVWAECTRPKPPSGVQAPRIPRHPYGATTIEIADLLAIYYPQSDWRDAERLTRIALLPSRQNAPIAPKWLVGDGEEPEEEEPRLLPWRVEGLGIPVLRMLDLLARLPLTHRGLHTTRRLGVDLSFWGLAAKFGLELLAQEHFLPGLRAEDGAVCALWLPALQDIRDQARLAALAKSMPPACRALFRERAGMERQVPSSAAVLESFLEHLVDAAVRDWSGRAAQVQLDSASAPSTGAAANDLAGAWWRALWREGGEVNLPPSRQRELTRFYQAWQSWTYRAQPTADSTFRLCFRLEPPEFDAEHSRVVSPNWTLRYVLQANDDPSLLVPAKEVWRERGNVLSYLSHRFEHPQEQLLTGLGIAARVCPAIQRSLKSECPESTTLGVQEAYTFLRETARLLEGSGFGVMVPPWWNKPDAQLRVRARLRTNPQATSSGILSMDALIAYDWQLAMGDEPLTREEFERLAALKTPLVQVRGRWVLLQPDQVEAAIAFWEKHQAQGEVRLRDALSLALGATEEIDGLPVGELELDDGLADLVKTLQCGDQLEALEPPPGFVGQLRPYQVRGLSWLAFLRRWGFGACLADDMGLGKTIQAIGLLLHERKQSPNAGPTLVVCPTSVVGNWQREVARFAPSLRAMVHHGTGRAEGQGLIEQSMASDLVISTYGLARRDIDDLVKVPWANIILDEAQNIKNPLTKQARAVRRLKAGYRMALTGTPVENRLSELWSIMSFLNPGYLGSLEAFRRSFALPIERYQDQQTSERLRKLVRPFVLRRLKTDPRVIQDLPEKFEYRVFCNLTREQATLYEAVVQEAMGRLQAIEPQAASMQRRGQVLAMLTRLKQVCNHPALFLGDGSELPRRSGKLNRLGEMLEEVLAVGDRALIFTQFAQMGHLLQRHLQDTFGQEVLFLHGGTPQKQRDRMVQRFQEDAHAPAIFVLSLKAGGTGLNLMRANHVFHYDRWWNPAVENQATDRAYRIGQTRDVQVHKLLCVGTLEERIDMLIESKRELAESVIGAGEDWLTELSTDELRDLITLRTEAVETA